MERANETGLLSELHQQGPPGGLGWDPGDGLALSASARTVPLRHSPAGSEGEAECEAPVQVGVASWYGEKFKAQDGRGERFRHERDDLRSPQPALGTCCGYQSEKPPDGYVRVNDAALFWRTDRRLSRAAARTLGLDGIAR